MGKRQFQLSDTEIGQLRQQEQQTRLAVELKRLQGRFPCGRADSGG